MTLKMICFIDLFDVRLVDGPSPKEGRLEVLHINTWGAVCNQGWFHSRNSPVVRKQLGTVVIFFLPFLFYLDVFQFP